MPVERGFRARFRYRWDEFLSGGAGRQLLFLFVLTMALVVVFAVLSLALTLPAGETTLDKAWFYFTRFLDAGTMSDDEGYLHRFVSTSATIMGVVVAGLLISSLSGNFQERLEAIRHSGSPVMEQNHFLILGWSEKIYSVVDQISEAYLEKRKIVVVVMAERDKIEMEEKLREKVVHQDRVKLVVRSGSSLSLNDLAKVSFDYAQAIIVLLDEADVETPSRADGRVIKTLLAIYNHPDFKARHPDVRVTAEVMDGSNQEIALIASGRRANVVRTNEIISKIILQTSRIGGLSLVYDELLRFEDNEIHFKRVPEAIGQRFENLLLSIPNGCLVGVAKSDGSSHLLNPPADYIVQPDEELLIVAEDARIEFQPYHGPLSLADVRVPVAPAEKPVEHMLVLGWNEKIFPIVEEFGEYVGAGSTLTLVNSLPIEDRNKAFRERCSLPANVEIRHMVGEFTNRPLMQQLHPERYPTVMVLGDGKGGAEEADTRAIIALLLLRDFRKQAGIRSQEVCSEILDPKNRELAATTEIHDIVISNEMVSMVLAQITYEPRIRSVLEDLFQSDGSEIYLKDLALYSPPGQPTTFEHLLLTAKARGEVAFGLQIENDDPATRYGIKLNPSPSQRRTAFVPKPGDRLIVLAEDDG